MDQLKFTIPEILSFIGVAQCVYVLVYIAFRAGRLARAGLPILYFFVLGVAFFYDAAANYIGGTVEYYDHIRWAAWFYGPPLSVLLIMQIAQITKVPDLKYYWVIFLIPAAYAYSRFNASGPENLMDWLVVSGLVAGTISLLTIWANKQVFEPILVQKTGKERYWLILAIIMMNISFLVAMLVSLNPQVSEGTITLARTILGLGFVYLVSTSLFRIYPQAVRLEQKPAGPGSLTDAELDIALKIEQLMNLDKVYQEPTYSRTDLARECGVSEALVSKIINEYFKRSLPQLLNERRIEDAKRLLVETDAPVNIIAQDVGFNSLPSFNRVFKEFTSESPSQFRKRKKR